MKKTKPFDFEEQRRKNKEKHECLLAEGLCLRCESAWATRGLYCRACELEMEDQQNEDATRN